MAWHNILEQKRHEIIISLKRKGLDGLWDKLIFHENRGTRPDRKEKRRPQKDTSIERPKIIQRKRNEIRDKGRGRNRER